MKRRSPLLFLEVALALVVIGLILLRLNQTHTKPGEVEVTLQLRDAQDKAVLYRLDDGSFRFRIQQNDGRHILLAPDELAARMYPTEAQRTKWGKLTVWARKLLNVSSPAGYLWVGLGALGQLLFTGRMIVQWLASEKNQKVTVPPAFWWMSLGGASMLMVYFLWREDPIGLLGQSIGWFVYIRNLVLIYRPRVSKDQGQVAVP